MTEPATARRPARGERGRGTLAGVWASAAVFLALLALLAARVSAGQDPALRARVAATPPPARRVLVRRVLERRVIVHLPPSMPAQPASASQTSAGASLAFPAPVTRTS
jgi:hypothetical protein